MKRIINAAIYSLSGIKAAFKSEVAFRQDLLIFSAGIIALVFLDLPYLEELFMAATLAILLISELTNTAIETVVDRIGTEVNPLSKMAKDIGSSIVFLSLVLLIFVWGSILYHRFI